MVVSRTLNNGFDGNTSTSLHGDRLVPRLLLGRRLRDLRETAGISQERAARTLRVSSSKISRLERGNVGVKRRDVADLLTLYGVRDKTARSTPLALVDAANVPPWWQDHHDVVDGWAGHYLSAERAARLIRCFDARLIPSLMQTSAYAYEAVRLANPGATEHELSRRVDLCMQRQRIVRRRPRPVNLWVVVHEAVLWRPITGMAIMRAQLEHLIDICLRPNVTLQILPSAACDHAETDGPLTLLRFQEPGLPDMIHLDRPGQATYPQRPAEIEHCWHTFNTLVTEAASPEHTPQILSRLLTAYRPAPRNP